MRAEQLHLVECAHNDFMHEITFTSFYGSSITANDFIWGKFSEFRICISYVYLQSVFRGSMFLF